MQTAGPARAHTCQAGDVGSAPSRCPVPQPPAPAAGLPTSQTPLLSGVSLSPCAGIASTQGLLAPQKPSEGWLHAAGCQQAWSQHPKVLVLGKEPPLLRTSLCDPILLLPGCSSPAGGGPASPASPRAVGTSPVPTPARRATCSENPSRPAGPDKAFPCASCPWYFSLASSPVLSHRSAPPCCPFPSHMHPSGSRRGLQLACTEPRRPQPGPRRGDLLPSGRGLLGQRLTQLGSRGRPTLAGAEDAAAPVPAAPRLQARGPAASRLPAPRLPNFAGVFAQFPSHRAREPNPSWLAACLAARHEKHSGFSQGSAGKSCQHQRQHRGAPPPVQRGRGCLLARHGSVVKVPAAPALETQL